MMDIIYSILINAYFRKNIISGTHWSAIILSIVMEIHPITYNCHFLFYCMTILDGSLSFNWEAVFGMYSTLNARQTQ